MGRSDDIDVIYPDTLRALDTASGASLAHKASLLSVCEVAAIKAWTKAEAAIRDAERGSPGS